jgi:hypothetical protein
MRWMAGFDLGRDLEDWSSKLVAPPRRDRGAGGIRQLHQATVRDDRGAELGGGRPTGHKQATRPGRKRRIAASSGK